MDFEKVVKALLAELEQKKIRYGAIGGFALALLGVPRNTADLDFLVHRDDLESLRNVLADLGYQQYVSTENVSHFQHGDSIWGAIDILHAFRTHALAMLERARALPAFDGQNRIKVLEPEDVIGLKVQAMANDAMRKNQETADIESLMALYGKRLDWDRIEEFYNLFEFGSEASELRKRYQNVE